jgi:hypothetical protein
MNLKLYWEDIIGYFEEEEWPLSELDDDVKKVVTHIRGDNVTLRVYVWLSELSKTLYMSWVFPNIVPSNKRHAIPDLLNRLNHKIMMGKFVMDPEDGFLSFRIAVSVKGARFSMAQFESFMNSGIWTADQHYPKFMYLIYGDHTVDEVLEEEPRPRLRLVQKTEEQAELFEEDEACT